MTNDSFYRSMTGNQLQATGQEVNKNIQFEPSSVGMKKEMKILRDIAKERGLELGNPFHSIPRR